MTFIWKYRARVFLLLFLFLGCLPVSSQTIPSRLDHWVTDEAEFLSTATRNLLDAQLQSFESQTGHQFVIYIGHSTGDIPLEDWAVKAFETWGIGRKGEDDGVALILMAGDKTVRIEVGYGLEGVLPDASAGRIIREILLPLLQTEGADNAVSSAASAIMTTISSGDFSSGERSVDTRDSGKRKKLSPFQLVLVGIAVIFFLILLITNPSLALYLLFSILSGGRGGGGGGGFGGGGGRSGGGGASGSW